MKDIEKAVDADTTILGTIHALLERRGALDMKVTPKSKLAEDLGLDSLELAELSAVLEDELGRDPFSEGVVPDTVADLVDFYGT